MQKKGKSLAVRITSRVIAWSVVIVVVLSGILFYLVGKATSMFYAEICYNKMFIAKEYTRRVTSDVYVAVTNNIYYIEQTLDQPDAHKETMARIVKSGTRIRSCGVSFIADYYPQKGHSFCPYAWRNTANPDVIYTEDLGDAASDYLESDWFRSAVESDSAQWSEPFYGGYFKTPTAAYMAPIHDRDGRVVAMIGADISLDWLTGKMNETDSTINKIALFPISSFKIKSNSFIINHDGRYLIHPDEDRILKDNFFDQIKTCDGGDAGELVKRMKAGEESSDKRYEKIIADGEECFLFYTPVKYTKWIMVYVVPCHEIYMAGYLNSVLLLFFILAAVFIVLVSYHYVRKETAPLKPLKQVIDSIAKGNFNVPVPELKQQDEISDLCDSIDEMKYWISNYIDEANRSKRQSPPSSL